MKHFMTTTALVAILAGPALAQTDGMESPFYTQGADQTAANFELRASDLIGMRLYTSETELTDTEAMEVSTDWNDIGEISDILLARDGSTEAVLLDIGGFLGLGERTVAVTMDRLQILRDGDNVGDYFIVVNSTQDQLENAPEFDDASVDTWMSGNMDAADTDSVETANMKSVPVVDETAQTDSTQQVDTTARVTEPTLGAADTTTNDMVMDDMVEVAANEVNTDNLIGARVYDSNDEWVGEVSELLVSDEGMVSEVVMDIGGFLGLGERQVAVSMDELRLMQQAQDADDVSVHVNVAGESMRDMPEWTDPEG